LGVAFAKFAGFVFTGAASLLAEAFHSVADTGNQLLLLLGAARARRPPTPSHSFGYGRERYFWAFVVAVVLFTLGSLFAIAKGTRALRDPHMIDSPAWALGILAIALVLEAFSLRIAVRGANELRNGQSWWAFIRHAKTPELPVVLLEDLGALVGLIIALVFVGLAPWTGDPRYDAAGSLAIGVLLGAIALVLGAEMKSLLIGESASPRAEQTIREALESHSKLLRLIHLRTQHLGPDELFVAAKVELEATLSLPEAARVIDEVQARVREHTPAARVIYVDPDVVASGEGAPLTQ
jgi:cation diffusion facilitator family transporter